ncbi:MAG TPA: hypothetical protein VFZ78_07700 [Flavisolibacter sp.]
MYKIVFALIFLASCGGGNVSVSGEHAHDGDAVVKSAGTKWKLDDPTRQHIAAIEKILGADHSPALAADLRKETDQLLKDCRMKGPDHDALHAWLEPFLQDLKRLESDQGDAHTLHSLQNRVSDFHQQFE